MKNCNDSSATSSVPGPSLIRLEGISKSFGKIRANHNISLNIVPGRITALLGENGAGKSTLMSIVAGRLEPDSGHIFIDGQPRAFSSPKDALRAGIGMVYQHFMLINTMSVAENILLGFEKSFRLNLKGMYTRLEELSSLYGLEIDPTARISTLSMGERQRVEILKLLCRESRVLIFDEPTSMLTPKETTQLFAAMRRMAAKEKSIIFISHKLPEILEISDEIAILRRGEVVDAFARQNVPDASELARRMLGRDLRKGDDIALGQNLEDDETIRAEADSALRLHGTEHPMNMLPLPKLKGRGKAMQGADPVLVLSDVSCFAPDSGGIRNITFTIAKGQILAITGVAGNGQKELVEVISGLRKPDKGAIRILGLEAKEYFKLKPAHSGLGYIPEDRRGVASCPELDLVDNFLLTPRQLFTHAGILDRKRALGTTRALIDEHNVQPGDPAAKGKELSGGNLQKLIVGRELLRKPGFIIAENPTQGLDVAAMEEVWQRLRIAKKSSGILLVTGDISEALALADHLAVMYRGRIVDLFRRSDQEKVSQIGLMMAGIAAASHAAAAETF